MVWHWRRSPPPPDTLNHSIGINQVGLRFLNKLQIKRNSFADETLLVPTEQRDNVREFIEELVASMVVGGDGGGVVESLDNVPIGQLYKDLECKCNISKHAIHNFI